MTAPTKASIPPPTLNLIPLPDAIVVVWLGDALVEEEELEVVFVAKVAVEEFLLELAVLDELLEAVLDEPVVVLVPVVVLEAVVDDDPVVEDDPLEEDDPVVEDAVVDDAEIAVEDCVMAETVLLESIANSPE